MSAAARRFSVDAHAGSKCPGAGREHRLQSADERLGDNHVLLGRLICVLSGAARKDLPC